MTANFLGEKSSYQPETLQDCLKQSIITHADVEKAAAALLEFAEAVSVGNGIYATLPSLERRPPNCVRRSWTLSCSVASKTAAGSREWGRARECVVHSLYRSKHPLLHFKGALWSLPATTLSR